MTDLMPFDVSDDLEELLAAHPLPDGVDDADMNMDEVAQAFNVSGNSVSKWIKAGMPVVQTGGNGQAYILRLSHCWAWRADDQRRETEKSNHNKKAIQQLQMSFLNLEGDDPSNVMDHKTRKLMSEADFAQSRAAQARRQLVPLEEVQSLLETLCTEMRESIEGMPDLLERELSLDAQQLEQVQVLGNDILNNMAKRIAAAELEEKDIGDMGTTSMFTH